MIYCFDTSAINRLLDDSEREPIIKAILSIGSFRITAYNVIEAAKTKNNDRRTRLIELMKQLTAGKRPLDRPNTILRTYANAHAKGASSAMVNTDENLEGLWIGLNEPHLVDERARQEVFSWAEQWEGDFSQIVVGDRDKFQELFNKEPQERPLTVASTLRAYLNKKDACRSLINEVYERETGKSLTGPEYQTLVREPVWALYFLAYAYALHRRAVQSHNFSRNQNAGAIDLGQAVYLTLCDRFITDDRAQCRALRLLNVFNTKSHAHVMRYDLFRHRLLVLA